MDSQQNSSVDFDLFAHDEKCLQENIEINSLTFSYTNMKEKMLCFYNSEQFTEEDEKPILLGNITKHVGKKVEIIF